MSIVRWAVATLIALALAIFLPPPWSYLAFGLLFLLAAGLGLELAASSERRHRSPWSSLDDWPGPRSHVTVIGQTGTGQRYGSYDELLRDTPARLRRIVSGKDGWTRGPVDR